MCTVTCIQCACKSVTAAEMETWNVEEIQRRTQTKPKYLEDFEMLYNLRLYNTAEWLSVKKSYSLWDK